jgi:glycosyltransferase involved in cell wall biosynthesis
MVVKNDSFPLFFALIPLVKHRTFRLQLCNYFNLQVNDPVMTKIQGPAKIEPVRTIPRHVRQRNGNQYIKKLSIIIPCYNEASTIALLLDKVIDVELPVGIEKEIIVINDCSKDDTNLMINEYLEDNPNVPIRYIQHTVNQGKGAAVHTGIATATGDYLIIQDADLEYDPKEYTILLKPILSGDADIVYGSRFMGGNPHRILFFWHTLGNKMLTVFSNLFTNMNLTDAHTCYKLLPTYLIRQIPLKEKRFAFDAELNVKISRLPRQRVYEVGISYYGRTFAEGKKIRFRDALRTVFSIIKYSLFTSMPDLQSQLEKANP